MLSGIKAVLFDFDHTLGIDNKLEFEAMGEVAKDFCRAQPTTADIQAVLDRFRYGPVSLDQALGDGLRSWGCQPENIDAGVVAFRRRSLELAPQRVTAMPGATEMLAALRARGMPMGILSNGWTELQHEKAELIGFPGPVFASEEIDAWKPDVRAFEVALTRCHMSAPSTLYVGDNPRVDIAGAHAAWMRAAWADLEGATYPSDLAPPELTIHSLSELPSRIA